MTRTPLRLIPPAGLTEKVRVLYSEVGDHKAALKCGVARQTLSRLMAGQSCQANTICAVAARLGVDLAGSVGEVAPSTDHADGDNESAEAVTP